jgi:hypothetical protein
MEKNVKKCQLLSCRIYLHEQIANVPDSLRHQAAKDEGICQPNNRFFSSFSITKL